MVVGFRVVRPLSYRSLSSRRFAETGAQQDLFPQSLESERILAPDNLKIRNTHFSEEKINFSQITFIRPHLFSERLTSPRIQTGCRTLEDFLNARLHIFYTELTVNNQSEGAFEIYV